MYQSAQRGYILFCSQLNLQPLPASEDTLILYVTHLAQTRAHSTIRTYLAGVRHMHVISGLGNPLDNKLKLNLVLKGINRVKLRPSYPRLPVTPPILCAIKRSLEAQPGFENIMLWAACCTAFFGFMRCAEFTVQSTHSYDSRRHLSVSDISVNSYSTPSTIAVRLKVSKTDPFGAGTTVYLGRTSNAICPVSAMLHYLSLVQCCITCRYDHQGTAPSLSHQEDRHSPRPPSLPRSRKP